MRLIDVCVMVVESHPVPCDGMIRSGASASSSIVLMGGRSGGGCLAMVQLPAELVCVQCKDGRSAPSRLIRLSSSTRWRRMSHHSEDKRAALSHLGGEGGEECELYG